MYFGSAVAGVVVLLSVATIVRADVPLRPRKAACSSDRDSTAVSDNGALKAVGELDESDLDVLVNSPTGVEFEMDGLNVHFLQNGEVAWFQPGECVRLPSGSVHCQYDHPFGGTSRKAKLKPIRARPPAVRFVVKQIRIPAVECGPGPASVRILYGPSGSETVHSGAVANCEQRGDRTFCRN